MSEPQSIGRRPGRAAIAAVVVALLGVVGVVVAKWGDGRLGAGTDLAAALEVELNGGYLNLGEGDADLARRAFEAALALDPLSVEAVAGLAMVYQRVGSHDAAIRILEAFDGARTAGLLRLEADALRRAGRSEDAEILEKTIPRPAGALDRFILGMQALRAGESGNRDGFPYAVHHLKLALMSAEVQRPLQWYQYAHAVGHEGRSRSESELAADVLVERWPDSAQAWFWAGFALRDFDRERAVRSYRAAKGLGIDGVPINYHIGLALAEDNKLADAVVALAEAAKLEEADRSVVLARMGRALTGLGRFEDAMTVLQDAITADKDNADALLAAGLTLREWGVAVGGDDLVKNAIATLEKAATVNPESATIAYELGVARGAYEDHDGAIAAYETAVKIDPTHDGAWTNLGTELGKLDRLDEAIARWRVGARHCPRDYGIHYNLGTSLVRQGMSDEAVEVFATAVKINPEEPRGWINYGQALSRCGRLRASLDAYSRGHAIARETPGWQLPSEKWVADARKRVAKLERLKALAEGAAPAADDDVDVWFAFGWQARQYELGTLYAQRVIDDSSGSETLAAAARFAAKAGEGARARQWLERALAKVPSGDQGALQVKKWIADPGFSSVQSLANLEADERAAWTRLWARVVERAGQ